jgi:hypothetical protein
MAEEPVHPQSTQRSGYRYTFTGKHHGGGSAADACWADGLSREEEFLVFDLADLWIVLDEDGRLYGVLRTGVAQLRVLGTWQQQIAEFPRANAGVPWHGYPIWPVNELAPASRASQKVRPSKAVFARMEEVGLITARQRKRLYKGDHV